jgi:PAS domain S-box-containing protein
MDLSPRNQAHIESERLAAIVSSSDDAIVGKTLEGVIISWNAGATRIFGWTAEEMVGQPILRIIPPELHHEEREILAKLKRGERIEHYETVRVTKDGRAIDISLTVSPIRNQTGEIIGASKVARDVTERRNAERAQRLMIEELNHRVRNTLAVVQSIASQTLARSSRPSEFAASFAARIRALASAHTLLSQSAWQGAELRELIKGQVLVGGDDERITCSGPSVLLEPNAALHLALVLHELSTNARKHGALSVPSGRLDLSWSIRLAETRSLLLNWVETGHPGIRAPKAQGFGTRLFEHSGGISIRYEAGGIRCEIVVPLPAQMPLPPGAKSIEDRYVAEDSIGRPTLRGRRVLVVDDEPLVAMDLAAMLEEAGCTVEGPVATVEQAMQLLGKARFDAALLDINLAGIPVDGLAGALAKRNVPFAFVTGYGREMLPEGFREARIIAKPFSGEQVVTTLSQLLLPAANVVPLRRS